MELEKDDQHSQVDSEEESDPTIVPRATYTKSYQCMNCFTDESKIWRRSPSDFDRKRKVFHKVLCDECGIYWLKYAKTKPIAPEKKSANSTPTLSIMMTAVDEDRKRKRSTDIVKAVTKKHKDTVSYSPFGTTCTHGLNNFFFQVRQPSPLHFEPTPCKVCFHTGPSDQLYVCHGCGMSVHDGKRRLRKKK